MNIYEKSIVVTFERAELEDEQWEDIKNHSDQSGMDLEEFLGQMGKIVEGYIKRENESILIK